MSSISVISQTPLSLFAAQSSELVPEDEDDEEVFKELGTRTVVWRLYGRSSISVNLPLVSQNIAALSSRRSGVRLYADALRMGTSAGQYREFWRVIEAAFAERDTKLVHLLSQSEIAMEMEFSRGELEQLHTLRGRASHAQSRAGAEEIERVETECAEKLGRLQGLARELLVRKRSWGDRSPGANSHDGRLACVRPDGGIVIHRPEPPTGS